MKVIIEHADTCLPDYWGGHHLPHISVPVHKGITLRELKHALRIEVSHDAIAGNYDVIELDGWYDAARAAIDAIEPRDSTQGDDALLFNDLPATPEDDADALNYAYFVFVYVEGITH